MIVQSDAVSLYSASNWVSHNSENVNLTFRGATQNRWNVLVCVWCYVKYRCVVCLQFLYLYYLDNGLLLLLSLNTWDADTHSPYRAYWLYILPYCVLRMLIYTGKNASIFIWDAVIHAPCYEHLRVLLLS